MPSWYDFETADRDLATFGARRLNGRVAYLATLREDSAPRVHPVTPIIGEGRLFLFMEPTSPKVRDLRRDPRYALHCWVEGSDGGEGELFISGSASFVEDPALRASAVRVSSYAPRDRYVLFELSVESAVATIYDGDKTVRRRWKLAGT